MTDLEPPPDWGDHFNQPWRAEITHMWGPFYDIRYHNGVMEEIGIAHFKIGRRRAERKGRRGAARRNRKPETWTVP